MSLNKLMFQVGIKEVEKKIADIRAQYDSFADKYAGGIAVKLKLEGIETAISGLEKMGDSKKLKPARDEVENLKKSADATTKSFNVANMEIARLYRILRVADSTSGRFADLGFDTSRIENYKRSLIEVRNTLETIRNNGGVMPGTGKTATAFLSEQATSKTISNLQAELNYYKQIETQMQRIETQMQRIETLRAGLSGVFGGITDPSKQQAISATIRDLEDLNGVIARSSSNDNIARFASVDYRRVLSGAKDMLVESRRELKATDKEAQNAEAKIRTLGQAFNNLKNYSKQNGSSDEMKRLQAEIQETIRRMRTMMNEGNYKGASSVFSRHQADIKLANAAIRDYERAQRQAANATNQTASAQQHLSSSVQSSNRALMSQSSILNDLKSLAKQYLGVWGAQTFFNKIIETGGLLEQQRLSIGAILGNTSQANQLFGQIQKLAVKSPFGVVQLDTMSKQLTAYNFKYHELYDWTKRLADISAATGTEVSRLSLALGHVRSEGALSGYTLRQFAMGNVPLLQTLAKQLGKTTSEIRKMVRGKEISYEDVATALKSLTENGGMFENAQEVMSGALNAKFKNLRDAFDIMYGQMAESVVGDALKKVAETLTVMAKHWEETGAVVLTVAGYFGIQRLSMMAANQAMVQGNLITGRFTAEQLKAQAATGNLTRQQLLRAVASGKVAVADAEAAGATLALSRAQLQHVKNTGKVSAAMNMASLSTSKYTVSQLRLLATMKKFKFGWLAQGFLGIANGARVAGAAIKGFMASMWPLLAISVLVEGVTRYMKKISDAKERVEELRQAANEGYKNLEPEAKNFKIGASVGMDSSSLSSAIEDMERILKDYSPQSGNVLTEAFKIDKSTGESVYSLAERYEMLAREIDDTKNAYQEMGKISGVFEDANDDTDGWFDESFRENTEDYISALSERNKALEDFISKNRTDVIGALARTREAFAEYDAQVQANNIAFKQTGGKEGFGEDDLKAQLELLRTNQQAQYRFYQEIKKGSSDASSAWDAYSSAMGRATLAQRKMDEDLKAFTESAVKRLEVRFGTTYDKFDRIQKLAVQKSLEIFMAGIDGYSNLADKERMEIEEKLLKDYEIEVDVDAREANKGIVKLQENLNAIVGREWVVRIGLDKATDTLSAIELADKKIKDNEKIVERLEGVKGFKKDKNGYYIIPNAGVMEVVIRPNLDKDAFKTEWKKQATYTYNEKESEVSPLQSAIAHNQAKQEIEASKAVLKEYGISPEENKKKGRNTGNKTDEELKVWRNRIQLLEKYRQQVDELEKLVGRVEAEATLKANGNFSPLWSYFGDPNDYDASLQKAISVLSGKTSDDRKSFIEELGAKREENSIRKLKDDLSAVATELGRMLPIMAENYETYKKWVDLTGNTSLAAQIAGVAENGSFADYLKDAYDKNGGFSGMSADDFFNLDYLDAIQSGESSISFKLWKDWQENNEKIRKDNLKLYEDAIKAAKGYEDKIADVNRELEKEIEAIRKLSQSPDEEERLIKNAEKKADKKKSDLAWENFKDVENWGEIFGNLDRISTKTLKHMIERLRELAPELSGSVEATKALYKAMADMEKKVAERNPFGALVDAYKDMVKWRMAKKDTEGNAPTDEILIGGKVVTKKQIDENAENAPREFADSLNQAINELEKFKKGLDLLANTFDALGFSGASNTISDISSVFGSTLNGASVGASIGGPWGAAVGAGLGLISGIAQTHDKSLERQIQGLREDVQKIDNTINLIKSLRERTLGYDNGDRRRALAAQYKSQMEGVQFGNTFFAKNDANAAMYEYYSRGGLGGNGYTQELNALKKKREDYQKMYDAENDKKKKSTESLEEYKVKMAELDEQIMYYTEDLARELWGIDIKGWADQIGDALVTAFKNGTSMAEAYHDAVENIMSDVVSNMMKVGIIEPMFEKLRRKLFGYTDEGGKKHDGVFDIKKPEESAKKAAGVIAEWFGPNGEGTKTITAANEYLTQTQKMMEANGLSIKSGKGTSAAKSVQSTITEETGGMLYGVFNAFRQDASVMRMVAEQFVNSYWANYMEVVTSASDSLRSIEQNTNAIFRMMNDGQGAMFDEISSMRKKMDSFTQPDGRLRVS